MADMPYVVSAEHRGGYRIHLAFSDGLEKTAIKVASLSEGLVCWPPDE